MIYMHRYTPTKDGTIVDIAVCETPGPVALYEASGYTQCSLAAFRAAWRLRDHYAYVELYRATPTIDQERAVGRQPSGVLARLPRGFTEYRG